ncbi:Cyclic nucleotide-binding domain-containing protein 2 [Boothiomyces macroporosus]|uniref:Cyclic nucleotide-binding domain-containing protein 2 n=1 Tax=Boothiomyces macroporosus TaxID=261099 RepID=A0AAD5UQ67_9FUNG|nr:Cyclic nucleotide-binding domain-containing protein 2 [Boothiomyces macroporosus]
MISIIPNSVDRSDGYSEPVRPAIIPRVSIKEEPLPPIDNSLDGSNTQEDEEPIPRFLGRMSKADEQRRHAGIGFEESKPLAALFLEGGFNSRRSFLRNQQGFSARNKKTFQKYEKVTYFMDLGCMLLNSKEAAQRGDTHVLSPRHKWQFAIKTVLKLIKSLDYKNGPCAIEIDPDPERDIGADVVLKLFKHLSQISSSTKIQQYYKRSACLTRQESLSFNHILMNRLSFFSKLSYEQRFRLTQYLTFEFHKKGIPVIQRGNKASRVYFLLSGQCKVYKPAFDGQKESLVHSGYLDIGESIGQDNTEGTYQETVYRNSTIVCATDCEFLSLDRDDYWQIMMNEDTKRDVKNRVSILKSVPIFENADDSILEQSVSRTKIRYYDRYTKILSQGVSNRCLFWILSGRVRLDKQIQFVRNVVSESLQRPDTTDSHISHHEQRVSETVSIGELETNGSFPEPLPESFPHIERGSDRLEFISKISDHDALQLNKSTVSVHALCPVVCLVMERIDFMRVMSWSMFDILSAASLIYSVNVSYINQGEISAGSMAGC